MTKDPLSEGLDAVVVRPQAVGTPSAGWQFDADRLVAESPTILAVLRLVLETDAQADDVLGATFEIAMRRGADLRNPGSLRPWLLRIATREAFRLRRRLKRLVRLDGLMAQALSVPGPSEESVAVRQALATLPPRMRLAVVLHHMLNMEVSEVATILGVSPNTVKTQLRRALSRLREELKDD